MYLTWINYTKYNLLHAFKVKSGSVIDSLREPTTNPVTGIRFPNAAVTGLAGICRRHGVGEGGACPSMIVPPPFGLTRFVSVLFPSDIHNRRKNKNQQSNSYSEAYNTQNV